METIITTTTNGPILLENFKKYIVEVGSSRDDELQSFLDTATRKIELHCNKSLANHDITLVSDYKVSYLKLKLRPVTEIISVQDEQDNDVVYTIDTRMRKIAVDTPTELVVKYKTLPQVEPQHKQAILDYATLLYNGSTDGNEFKSVLLKCYNPID